MSQVNLLELAMAIVAAEEVNTTPTKVEAVKETSEPYINIMRKVSLPSDIVEIEGRGEIEELNIISSSKDYGLTIRIGGRPIMTMLWDDFNQISQFVDWVTAFQESDDGNYILTIYRIPFSDGIRIRAYPIQSLGESNMYLDYVMVKAKVVY